MSKYCSDSIANVENYELAKADNFNGWHLHHRLETHTSDGERRPVDLSKDELNALGMYYNRPASELIYMRNKDHIKLHHKGKRKETVSSEWYERNREYACARQRKYDKEHYEHKKAYMREYMRRYNQMKKAKNADLIALFQQQNETMFAAFQSQVEALGGE